MATAGSGCERRRDGFAVTDATISDVSIAETDIGDLLRITFGGLPADRTDPRFVHVTVGAVELVAEYEGDETVLFPATLTHAESRLLAGRLAP